MIALIEWKVYIAGLHHIVDAARSSKQFASWKLMDLAFISLLFFVISCFKMDEGFFLLGES